MKVPCCSVCQTRYNEEERVLLLLQCGHSFCKECLSKMFLACLDTTLSCLRCRHVSVVGNSIQALKKNFAVLALLSSSSLISPSAANLDCDYTDDEDEDDNDDDDGNDVEYHRRCSRGLLALSSSAAVADVGR